MTSNERRRSRHAAALAGERGLIFDVGEAGIALATTTG